MRDFKRIMKYAVPSLLILLIVISVVTMLALNPIPGGNQTKATTNVNVGIAFCGNTTKEAKVLIDRVKAYTNLFILDSGANPISRNQTAIEEICDYAVSQGLNVIINVGHIYSQVSWFWQLPSLDSIKQRWTERWGDKLLGIYYNDEPGGIQLDGNWTDWFADYAANLSQIGHPSADALYAIYTKMQGFKANGSSPQDYDLEAQFFIHDVLEEDPGLIRLKDAGITTFTSDYGLYWFDYLGGYDVMFAQIGWNCSVAQQLALVKGAARLQNKDWGAIITWKYGEAPYLDTGDQMYNQMLTAYQAGAKYIIVFNYPIMADNDYGALTDEHFIAIERFWKDITNQEKTKTFADLSKPEATLVLPKNYGWGMRNPEDVIWGFWGPDNKTLQVGTVMGKLLAQYGVRLDIVYDDPAFPVSAGGYTNIYYWNGSNWQSPEPQNSEPVEYTYSIVNSYPHDANAFTQGLIFDNGSMYEGTGLYGNSTLRRVDLATGNVLQLYTLPDQYFGEGITIVGDKIIQLTWQSNIGFVYDKHSFALLQEFSYPTEGWGITYDGAQLIMSDGTSTLYFLNPDTFQKTGQIQVHDNNGAVAKLNELEYINGKVYANVWQEEKIAVINPQTGQVEAWINLSGIQNMENPDPNSVLNGIAYDAENGRLFVTGKMWPQLYEIKLILVI